MTRIVQYFIELLHKEQKKRRPKRIILVRHGYSVANKNYDILQHTPDNKITLTEKGIETFEECIDIFGEFDVITFEGYSAEEKGRMEKQLKEISDKSLKIIK